MTHPSPGRRSSICAGLTGIRSTTSSVAEDSVHDAQDFTQEFFARLLEKNWLAHADQSRGRFRTFLLLVLKRFLAVEWHKANAQKRGAGRALLPLPFDTAETRFATEPADTCTPEQSFERQWALTLLENVLRQLRADYEEDGKGRVFEALKPCLMGSRESQPYAELAAEPGHDRRRGEGGRASPARALSRPAEGNDRADGGLARRRGRRAATPRAGARQKLTGILRPAL